MTRSSSRSTARTTSTSPRTACVADELKRFLSRLGGAAGTDRVLATVLFTDIVESTARSAELGTAVGGACSTSTTRSCSERSPASGGAS